MELSLLIPGVWLKIIFQTNLPNLLLVMVYRIGLQQALIMIKLIPSCSTAKGRSGLTPFHIKKIRYGVQLTMKAPERAQTVVSARALLLSVDATNFLEYLKAIAKRKKFMIMIEMRGMIIMPPNSILNRIDAASLV